ncbi:MAG: hypothetical protein ABT940_05875, partial [Alphaproteobacteria bacterium]
YRRADILTQGQNTHRRSLKRRAGFTSESMSQLIGSLVSVAGRARPRPWLARARARGRSMRQLFPFYPNLMSYSYFHPIALPPDFPTRARRTAHRISPKVILE